MALYYCCCWQIASKKNQLPHRCPLGFKCWCWEYFYLGQFCVLGRGRRGGGAKLSGGCPTPAQAGVPDRPAANSLPCCLASHHTWWGPGVGGGGSKAICSHVTFPTSKLCFYNYWPRLPQELWPPQRAVLFHFCQQWVFSLCSWQEGFCFMSFLPCRTLRRPGSLPRA